LGSVADVEAHCLIVIATSERDRETEREREHAPSPDLEPAATSILVSCTIPRLPDAHYFLRIDFGASIPRRAGAVAWRGVAQPRDGCGGLGSTLLTPG